MGDKRLGAVESRFADLVWENAPVRTSQLVKLCGETLGWKRTTTYTVLKKLCDRGLFRMEDKTVTSLLSREEYYADQSRQFVQETYEGSLPAFIAAFASRRAISPDELARIRQMLDEYERGE